MSSNRLDKLPDEIYKHILKYVFHPPKELKQFDKKTQQWNCNLFINKCHCCQQSATTIALSYDCNCNCNDTYNIFDTCTDGCKNKLICFDCAH